MRAFILVTCLLVGALARPDVGYAYNGLQSALPQNAHQLNPHVHQQLPAENSFASFETPQTMYLAPLGSSAAPALAANNDNLQNLDASSAPAFEDIPQSSQPLPLSNHQNHHHHQQQDHQQDSYSVAYQQSTNSHESGSYPNAPQETTIHKHIYVHVPPKDFEDDDVITPRVRHQAAPKQKHYKIVFIKAPAAPSISPPIIPPPPQNEEKTLIYVLHKKPELEQDIVIPTAAPTKPSKPEVYFIKYKTKKEEAPVYGPPPQQQQQNHQQQNQEQPTVFLEMQPRNIEASSSEYGTPMNDENVLDAAAPLTTVQPQEEAAPQQQQQKQQFNVEVPSDVYGTPTMSAVIVPEEPQPTLAAPSNQYLAPETQQTMSPIVVDDAAATNAVHVPASSYGPPNRFFLKKKK